MFLKKPYDCEVLIKILREFLSKSYLCYELDHLCDMYNHTKILLYVYISI